MDKEGLEKERDFYFNKLREIEIICQDHDALGHVKEIMDVLYATEVIFVLHVNHASAMAMVFSLSPFD